MSRFLAYRISDTPRGAGFARKLAVRAGTGTLIVVACFLLFSACGLFAQARAAAGSMRPLQVDPKNSHYFIRPDGQVVFLTGSQTWNVFQVMGTSIAPTPTDLHAFIEFLKAHGHNVTILWKKDLPIDCGWGAGGIWLVPPFLQRTGEAKESNLPEMGSRHLIFRSTTRRTSTVCGPASWSCRTTGYTPSCSCLTACS